MPDAGRVIAGSAKGVRLDAPGEGTRPLSDRVKQALLAALESDGALDGPFLDLFAGSGAAGIEALSRGAPHAVFVERDPRAAGVIVENLRKTGLRVRGEVVRADATRFLERDPAAVRGPFTAVLVDPPYGDAVLPVILERLGVAGRGWVSEGALVVAKHFWRDPPPEHPGALSRVRERRFGETMLTFYGATHRAALVDSREQL